MPHTPSVYTPAAFSVDAAEIPAILSGIVAADLVTMTEDGLLATYLPVLFDGPRFVSHMARNNEQWRQRVLGDALLIAHGPEAYISPTWYAATQEHGRVVPTYNYLTVHVYGTIEVHEDPAWLADAVDRLTSRHESGRDPAWSSADAPSAFIDGQLRAIVGLEFQIARVEVKRKMSQNRPEADVPGIVAGLTADGEVAVAAMVLEHGK